LEEERKESIDFDRGHHAPFLLSLPHSWASFLTHVLAICSIVRRKKEKREREREREREGEGSKVP
jgi:hypothetical protein